MAGVWTNFGLSCGLFLVCFVARSGCFCSWLWLVLRQGYGPIVACFTAVYGLLIVLILWNVDVCVQLY